MQVFDYGFRFRDIKVCKKIFTVCSILHNMMVDDRETRESSVRVGRGAPLGRDGMWIRNVVEEPQLPSFLIPLQQ